MTTLFVLLLSVWSPAAEAKDLRNRVGVGVNTTLGGAGAPPAVSVRYGLPAPKPVLNIQLEGVAGFSAQNGVSSTVAGGRLLYGVVAEDNLNVSVGAGAAYVSAAGQGVVRVQPAAQVDFFLFGLENLGFFGGVGLNLDVGSTGGAGTAGAALGGLHYWF